MPRSLVFCNQRCAHAMTSSRSKRMSFWTCRYGMLLPLKSALAEILPKMPASRAQYLAAPGDPQQVLSLVVVKLQFATVSVVECLAEIARQVDVGRRDRHAVGLVGCGNDA